VADFKFNAKRFFCLSSVRHLPATSGRLKSYDISIKKTAGIHHKLRHSDKQRSTCNHRSACHVSDSCQVMTAANCAVATL
jgi:hypothetical protein